MPLTLAVLRAANRRRALKGTIGSVAAAFETLDRGTVEAAAISVPVYDVLDPSNAWGALPGQLRMHGIAVRSVTERIAAEIGTEDLEVLRTAGMLHDIGKALMVQAFPDNAPDLYIDPTTPDDEIRREQELFGLDHARAGAWLLRSWGFPEALAVAVERHHEPGSDQHALIVSIADMLVHYGQGRPVEIRDLSDACAEIGLNREALGLLMYELPDPSTLPVRRLPEPCPLSERELDVLRLLGEGKVYKQIAAELQLSPSTVRSHLHRAYRRMGVVDRTQAVLMATELGWL